MLNNLLMSFLALDMLCTFHMSIQTMAISNFEDAFITHEFDIRQIVMIDTS